MLKPAPCVSVVIATYHRPDLLRLCLGRLLSQSYDPACYEIIVVDDGNSPTTRQLVERLAAEKIPCRPALRYLPVEGRLHGPALARNCGWRQAKGDIIAFTDDDCLPALDWLEAGMRAFTGEVVGVSGRVEVPLPPEPTDHELNYQGLTRSLFVTANCFYRRCALEAVGGFDERFRIAWREDSDLFFSLLEGGYKLTTAPAALVTHPVQPARWGSSLGQQRKSFYNALLYKKHAALYRQYLSPVHPWHYYCVLTTLLVTTFGLIFRRRQLSLTGSGLWLLLTTLFCLRRLKDTSHDPYHVAEMAVTSALLPPLSFFWRLLGALKFRVFFF